MLCLRNSRFGGRSITELFRLSAPDLSVDSTACYEPDGERERYQSAAESALAELDALYDMAMETDEATAQVFDIHRMMLDDPDFCDGIEDGIGAGHCAEFAVQQTADMLAGMFLAMEGGRIYAGARRRRARRCRGRLIRILKGHQRGREHFEHPVIVAAEDLLPSQTVRLDKTKVLGFVNEVRLRHLALRHSGKTLGIPCIVGMGSDFDARSLRSV